MPLLRISSLMPDFNFFFLIDNLFFTLYDSDKLNRLFGRTFNPKSKD